MALSADYVVRLDAPHRHEAQVELRLAGDLPDPLDVAMPVWNPGSYLVREFARNVEALSAEGATGALDVTKTRKDRWTIRTRGAREVTIRYRVYGFELSVRTNHIDDSHAHLEGPATLLYVPGALDTPARLRIEAPSGWRVACALPSEAGGTLVAADYDELVDSPIEALGPDAPAPLGFEAAGRPHEIVFWGNARFDRDRLAADLRAIVEAAARIFGDPPYERYLFIVHFVPSGRGGLEHRNSCTLQLSRYAFEQADSHDDARSLFAHEFFHLWNVKRIRPAGLSPYDYAAENYTRLLYLSEGMTAYYDWLLLRRAERVAPERYLKHLASEIQKLEDTPGRLVLSLEEASWDAWLKQYRQDENTVNTAVSYYTKGEIVAAMIDLEIRARTAERGAPRSLDDALRALWARPGRVVPEDDVARIVGEATGVDVGDLFLAYVRGRGPIDYVRHLARAGLTLRVRRREESPASCLGIRTRSDAGRLFVSTVTRDSAAERAGLYAGDEILAFDGYRVDDFTLRERLRARAPGDRARLAFFRRERLGELEVELGEAPPDEYAIVALEGAQVADAQCSLYAGWLGASWPPPPNAKGR